MSSPQSQIKVNLSEPMKAFLESKARKFGMPIAGYIKHLILKDIEDMDYPVYQASESTEKSYKKAMDELQKGKIKEVKDIDKFFEEL